MADDAGANANANLNANANPPAAPYAIYSYLFQFLLQFLVLAFGVDVICLSLLDMICSSILLVCMIRLIPAIIIMLYSCLFWIKSYGKLLIYSTYSRKKRKAAFVMERVVLRIGMILLRRREDTAGSKPNNPRPLASAVCTHLSHLSRSLHCESIALSSSPPPSWFSYLPPTQLPLRFYFPNPSLLSPLCLTSPAN
jgi:hypothetical protein